MLSFAALFAFCTSVTSHALIIGAIHNIMILSDIIVYICMSNLQRSHLHIVNYFPRVSETLKNV